MNTIAMDTFLTVDLSMHMNTFLSFGNFMRGYILFREKSFVTLNSVLWFVSVCLGELLIK